MGVPLYPQLSCSGDISVWSDSQVSLQQWQFFQTSKADFFLLVEY